MPAFTPEDPKKLALNGLFPKGEYDFEVQSAVDKISKTSGNPMIELKIVIFSGDRRKTVTDYLVFSEKGMDKIYGFARATGIEDKYLAGDISVHDVQGLCGKCLIRIEEDEDGQFDPKNSVSRYKKPKPTADAPKSGESAPEEKDDVPF